MDKLYASKINKNIIICGDYNIDLLNTINHTSTQDFTDTMFSLHLYPLVSKPTRITSHTATVIDNIFTNILDNEIISGILINDISDHFPVFMLYNLNRKNLNYEIRTTRNIKNYSTPWMIKRVAQCMQKEELTKHVSGQKL